ncbi:15060_t:CDS:2, partial [Dentiscutata erythropus]
MSAMKGELSVKLDNKRFDNGTLRSGESTKTFFLFFVALYNHKSIQKKIGQDQRKETGQYLIVGTNNPPINLDNILANPG